MQQSHKLSRKSVGLWSWHSGQTGRFQCQRTWGSKLRHHQFFIKNIYLLLIFEKDENKYKEARLAHI